MRNVTIQLRIRMTADDWQLYDHAGREEAAQLLSKGAEAILNAATTADAADRSLDQLLLTQRHFGAADSEGCRCAAQLIALRFPKAQR